MLLNAKTAIIFGAGGAIGGAVAKAFAREGARVFLSGRHAAPVEAVADDIRANGGAAEAATVDALDETAVEGMTLTKKLPTLADVAHTAVFLASDHAAAMTGAVANLTGGMSID